MDTGKEMARVKELLDQAGVKPKRAFGQNFLVDGETIERIVDYFAIASYDTVVEIGPGLGALTLPIMARARKLIAIENDRDMAKILQELVAGRDNIKIVNEPFEKWQPRGLQGKILLIGNLPYNLTTKLLECSVKIQAQELGFMVQKEVADKLVYKKNSPDGSALSCFLALLGRVEKVVEVPRGGFYPRPNVDSTFVALKVCNQVPFAVYEGLQKLFRTPNKKLSNVLPKVVASPTRLAKIFKDFADITALRARQVAPDRLCQLAQAIESQRKKL